MPVYRKGQMRAALNLLDKKKAEAILSTFGAVGLENIKRREYSLLAARLKDAGVDIKPAKVTDEKTTLDQMAADHWNKPPAENNILDAALEQPDVKSAFDAMAKTIYDKK